MLSGEEKAAVSDPLIGVCLGDYEIVRLIGRGGMARVYEGRDTRLTRRAAIKVVEIQHDGDPEITERFLRESRAVANLDHPNIVQVYQSGQAHGVYYLAMKLIEGHTLLSVIKRLRQREKFLDPRRILRVMEDIGSALDYAHSMKVIHRDIKPSNIMLTEDDRAILMDFGLLMQYGNDSTLGTAFGTPRYIAPEQAVASHRAVPQSDIYALGVILYEMVAGQAPFDHESPMSLALSHIHNVPPAPRTFRPDISEAVEAVILKALEKLPEHRWPTCAAMVAALRTAYAGEMPAGVSGAVALPAEGAVSVVTGIALPGPVPPGLLGDNPAGSTAPPSQPSVPSSLVPSQPIVPTSGTMKLTDSQLAAATGVGIPAGFAPSPVPSVVGLPRESRIRRLLFVVAVIAMLMIGFLTSELIWPWPGNVPTGVTAIINPVTPTLRLIYSADMFAIQNLSDEPVSLQALQFTNASGNSYAGNRFGERARRLEKNGCALILIRGGSAQRIPSLCAGVQPSEELNDGFWIARSGSAGSGTAIPGTPAVRVFEVWRDGVRLQVCSMQANTCDVALSR